MVRMKAFFLSQPLKSSLFGTLFFAFAAGLLAFPSEVKAAVLDSIFSCLTVLAPSLFPFLALTSFAVNSGASEAIGKVLGWAARLLFRLPSICAATLFLSFAGGYPAGAKGVSLLLQEGKITRSQAGRMMIFCVNPGIAFVVTFVGSGLLGSPQTGWQLFWAVTFSGLLLGVISSLFVKFPEKTQLQPQQKAKNALIRSASDACSSLLKLSACVVLFSGFTALLHGSGIFQVLVKLMSRTGLLPPPLAASGLSFSLEVTKGALDSAALRVGPELFAFGLAFGGLCVHLQIFSFFESFPLPKWKFFSLRLLHGLFAVGMLKLWKHFLPETSQAAFQLYTPLPQNFGGLSTSMAGGASLLLMCCAFLLVLSKENDCETGQAVIK